MTDDVDTLAAWIREYGSAEKILRLHVADASGRCPLCRSGGDSSGRVVAPCSLRLAALAAQRVDTGG